MNLDKEIERLSKESGMDDAEVKKGIDELIADGYDDVAALAIWKSDNSGKLGGRVVKDTYLRISAIDNDMNGKVVQTSKKGDQYGAFRAFVVDGEDVELCSFFCFKENAQQVAALRRGVLYTGTVKLKGEGDDGIMRAALMASPVEAPSTDEDKIPSVKELLELHENKSISKAADHIGSNEIFTGIIGKIIEKDSGARGLEVSDEGCNPIMVWLPQNSDMSGFKRGQRTIVHGFVNGNKGLTINGDGAYPLN